MKSPTYLISRFILRQQPILIAGIIALFISILSTVAYTQEIVVGETTDLSIPDSNTSSQIIKVSSDGTRATAMWRKDDVIQSASATITGTTAQWGSTTDVSQAAYVGLEGDFALSDDGTKAVAVWYVFHMGVGNEVYAATASIAGNIATWSAPILLSTDDISTQPRVALSSDGTMATAVWREQNTNNYIRSASATINANLASWGMAQDLCDASRDTETPIVSISSGGDEAVVVWLRSDGTNKIAQAVTGAITGNSGVWSTAMSLSDAGADAAALNVVIGSDGARASAIWTRSNGSHTIVQTSAATINANLASWGAASDLSASGQNADSPKLATSDDGSVAAAIWRRTDGTISVTQARIATISGNMGSWGTTKDFVQSGTLTTVPEIELSSDGTGAVATWTIPNGSNVFLVYGSQAILSGNSANWANGVLISDEAISTGAGKIGLTASGAKATFAFLIFDAGGNYVQARSAEITYSAPTPTSTPTIPPTPTSAATPTSTPAPTVTAVPTATPLAPLSPKAPKVKARAKKNGIIVSVEEKTSTKATRHTAYVVRESDYTIYKKAGIPIQNGVGKVSFRKVPPGAYRIFVVTKRSVKPKKVSSPVKLITIQ